MIKPKTSKFGPLKIGIIRAIIFGIVLAVLVYVTVAIVSEHIRVNYYATDEMREAREERLMEEFREYVADREISSNDKESIRRFAEQKTYIYLLIYKGDDFYFSSGMYDNANIIPLFSDLLLGGSIDYPTEEEMLEYARANDLESVEMADGAVFVSIAEFSEYFFTDVSRILSLGLAMLALALVITIYFFRVINRITRLAADVNAVADGDMSRRIYADGNDEISKLSHDVDNMRNAILQTLESEREARAANTELVTSMSHDIRTPLTVLIGYLDVMKMYSKDEIMDEYIKSSEKTAMRLKKLSDDMFKYLLVFGDAAKPCELEEYDCATLIDQLLAEHILLLRERGYDVRFTSGEATDVSVLTSAPELMRIIDNVFSNVRKYADRESSVYVDVSVGENKVIVSFANRISRDTTMAESTGIGLKTCAKIAEIISCEFSYSKGEDDFVASVAIRKSGK